MRFVTEERLRALALAEGEAPTAAAIRRVAEAVSAEAAQWAFTQWELRSRAAAKFSEPDAMLFTREALEQASSERLANYHASRFPNGETVVEMTAGIGADLIGLARRGPATGFEIDVERAEYAQFNLDALALPGSVFCRDAMAEAPTGRFLFADPARRMSGKRLFDPREFQPNPVELAKRFASADLSGMKLSPLLPDSFLCSFGVQLEFVSLGRECREALLWFGSPAGVLARHIESGETLASGPAPGRTEEPEAFFYEADPAAIRADALGALSDRFHLTALGESNGYLTGEQEIDSPWLRRYRVLAHGKADLRATLAELKSRDASTPTLKQRGVSLNLIDLRKQMRLKGTRRLVVAIWPVGKSLRHTVLETED